MNRIQLHLLNENDELHPDFRRARFVATTTTDDHAVAVDPEGTTWQLLDPEAPLGELWVDDTDRAAIRIS